MHCKCTKEVCHPNAQQTRAMHVDRRGVPCKCGVAKQLGATSRVPPWTRRLGGRRECRQSVLQPPALLACYVMQR